MSSIEHILKRWEKKYGYIKLSRNEREKFFGLEGKKFIVTIGKKRLLDRRIDSQGRIYVSKSPLRDLKVGDKLTISLDKDGLKVED